MEGKILFDISHLRFESKGEGDINNGMFKLSNIDSEREKFYTEIYKKQYGLTDTSYIPGSVFAYSYLELGDMDGKLEEQIQFELEEMMFSRLQHLEALLAFLWFVKDNSIGVFSTIAEVSSKRLAGKLSKSISYWNSEGGKQNTVFTKEEILKAAELTNKYSEICKREIPAINNFIISTEFDNYGKPYKKYLNRASNQFNYNEQNCIERAFNFLKTARSQSYIIYKIAYYMAAFEALFTTNSSEIVMRMSYRVGFFLGSNLNECHDIFSTIHNSYNIRSRFLHGQEFDDKKDIEIEHLIVVSKKLDSILREVFVKIMSSDELSAVFVKYTNKDRDTYLNNLVFGLPFNHELALDRISRIEEQKRIEAEKAEKKKLKTASQHKNNCN